jgi:uncharacterized lipoprotein YmbA
MTHSRLFLAAVLTALLAACGSTPQSDYYMLTADARGEPGEGGPSLGVGPVSIPEYLKTRQIVMNRSDHLLKLAEYDRWAEPLDAGVSRVVAVNLAVLMNTTRVQTFPWRRDATPGHAVRISVIQFAAQGSEAILVTEWSISRPRQGESGPRGITRLTTTLRGGEPEHVAEAYSGLLLELSEIIAGALKDELSRQAAGG